MRFPDILCVRGSCEAERAVAVSADMAEFIAFMVEFGGVRSHPWQRYTAAVAPLVDIGSAGMQRPWVFKTIPRDVGDLEQAELLALIDVC